MMLKWFCKATVLGCSWGAWACGDNGIGGLFCLSGDDGPVSIKCF